MFSPVHSPINWQIPYDPFKDDESDEVLRQVRNRRARVVTQNLIYLRSQPRFFEMIAIMKKDPFDA